LGAEYFVGIEGGVGQRYQRWFAFGGMCIIDSHGRKAFGTSPQFELPQKVVEQLVEGKELGDVIDEFTNVKNSKHKFGAIGYFTNGVMNRTDLYVYGLITALVPFLNEKLYF
jgi:inosine/xanthosine triphosphatase